MAFGDTFAGVTEDFKKLPWWAWVGIAGGGFILWQHFQSSGTTPASSTADTSASGLDTSGGDTAGGDVGLQTQPAAPPPGGKSPPPPPPSGKNPPPPPKSTKSYTVASGDTLSSIAGREGVDEQQLYSRNEGIIEATARQHGFASSENGHWIFPGERLVIG